MNCVEMVLSFYKVFSITTFSFLYFSGLLTGPQSHNVCWFNGKTVTNYSKKINRLISFVYNINR